VQKISKSVKRFKRYGNKRCDVGRHLVFERHLALGYFGKKHLAGHFDAKMVEIDQAIQKIWQ